MGHMCRAEREKAGWELAAVQEQLRKAEAQASGARSEGSSAAALSLSSPPSTTESHKSVCE